MLRFLSLPAHLKSGFTKNSGSGHYAGAGQRRQLNVHFETAELAQAGARHFLGALTRGLLERELLGINFFRIHSEMPHEVLFEYQPEPVRYSSPEQTAAMALRTIEKAETLPRKLFLSYFPGPISGLGDDEKKLASDISIGWDDKPMWYIGNGDPHAFIGISTYIGISAKAVSPFYETVNKILTEFDRELSALYKEKFPREP